MWDWSFKNTTKKKHFTVLQMLLAGHFIISAFSSYKFLYFVDCFVHVAVFLHIWNSQSYFDNTKDSNTIFSFAVVFFIWRLPLEDTLNLSEWWASNLCPQWILNSLSEKQIGSINIWKRDNRERMICDILRNQTWSSSTGSRPETDWV